jgi:hypothetical protein
MGWAFCLLRPLGVRVPVLWRLVRTPRISGHVAADPKQLSTTIYVHLLFFSNPPRQPVIPLVSLFHEPAEESQRGRSREGDVVCKTTGKYPEWHAFSDPPRRQYSTLHEQKGSMKEGSRRSRGGVYSTVRIHISQEQLSPMWSARRCSQLLRSADRRRRLKREKRGRVMMGIGSERMAIFYTPLGSHSDHRDDRDRQPRGHRRSIDNIACWNSSR